MMFKRCVRNTKNVNVSGHHFKRIHWRKTEQKRGKYDRMMMAMAMSVVMVMFKSMGGGIDDGNGDEYGEVDRDEKFSLTLWIRRGG